jgi:hypothetical protein
MQTENLYTTDCIRTNSGQYVNVFDPNPETILIEDVAHSLSHQCRFGGHLPYHFSVAMHSINVSYGVRSKHAFAGLMHDASEAYLLDIPRPIKNRMPEYKTIEDNLMKVIAAKFGFEYPLHDEVKEADNIALENEWREIFLGNSIKFIMPAVRSKELFLQRFYELT